MDLSMDIVPTPNGGLHSRLNYQRLYYNWFA
jgi:hypothetical protein